MTKSNDRGDRITAYINTTVKRNKKQQEKITDEQTTSTRQKNEEIPRKDYGRSRERNQKEIEYSYFPLRR